jgi:hypothetical protein
MQCSSLLQTCKVSKQGVLKVPYEQVDVRAKAVLLQSRAQQSILTREVLLAIV